MFKRLVTLMKRIFQYLFVLFLILSLGSKAGICVDPGIEPTYVLKMVIETTSDWTDIIWSNPPSVIASRYNWISGESSVTYFETTGLKIALDHDLQLSDKVTVEVEVIVTEIPGVPNITISKGSIGYTQVDMYRYNPTTESFQFVSQFRTSGTSEEFTLSQDIYQAVTGAIEVKQYMEEYQKKIFTFYYAWYGNPFGPSAHDSWGIVDADTLSASSNYPLMGPYDSRDESVVRAHMAMMKQAGIDGVIIEWSRKDLTYVLDIAHEYELETSIYGIGGSNFNEYVDWTEQNIQKYRGHPSFMHGDDQPILFIWSIPGSLEPVQGPEFWTEVFDEVESRIGPIIVCGDNLEPEFDEVFEWNHFYLFLEFFLYEEYYTEAVDSMMFRVPGDTDSLFDYVYANETIQVFLKPISFTIAPGYDDTLIRYPGDKLDRDDDELFRALWDTALRLDPHSIILSTWNEWYEGTDIEPSREHGFKYLEMTREYVEQYKQTEIPDPIIDFSAKVNEFQNFQNKTGRGEIEITTGITTPILVNISVIGDESVSSIEITGDFYSYVNVRSDDRVSILIPSIPPQDELDVEVVYDAETFNPWFNISVTAFDPSGRFYELYRGQIQPELLSSVSCSLSSESIEIGESITVSGSLDPEKEGMTITLSYVRPDSSTLTRTVTTATDGSYSDSLEPDVAGSWSVRASWEGDGEFEGSTSSLIYFTVSKTPSSVSIQTSESQITEGDSVTVSGSLDPAVSGAEVVIVYTTPDGSTSTRTISTGLDGSYSDLYQPSEKGSWSVKASWDGDSWFMNSSSETVSFTVDESEPEPEPEQKGIPGFPIPAIALGILLVLLSSHARNAQSRTAF